LLAAPLALFARASGQPARSIKITRFETQKALIGGREFLFLRIHTSEGITGLGEASLPARVAIVEAALQWLEQRLTGLDPAGIEDHWNRMYHRLSRWRDGSVLMTALSAVDIALWDIEGKRLGVPVWRLLGAASKPCLRVYYSHWDTGLRDRSPAAFAEKVAASREQGWTAVKWIVQRASTEGERVEQTAAHAEAVRKAGGRDFDFCLELFETFTVRSALELARAVAPYRPLFIEEPTLRESPQALGQLASLSPVPLAGGEGLLTRWDFRHLLDARGAMIIQPDVIHCGGITEMRKIASFAEVYGAELAPHQWYGPVAHVASFHAASSCRNFLIHEVDGANEKLFEQLTAGSYPVQKNGSVKLTDAPGLGMELDFAQLAKRFPMPRG
jgi:galactonate dehydratase